MYILKLDHKSEKSSLFTTSMTENLSDLRLRNRQNQMIIKKNTTLSERFLQTEQDQNYSQRKYSDSFRKMMNKVIHRINRRNNFIKNDQNKNMSNINSIQSLQKEELPQTIYSLDYPNRKSKIFYQQNKLKIKGIGKTEIESNLLQRQNKLNPFIKTSISFVKNKEFKKNIQCRRSKSFSSDISSDNSAQNKKQNSFILNNTRYCPAQFKKIMLEQSFKVGSFIPKITAKQNYQQMQQLMKTNIESKRNKIDVGKKLFHKKMLQKQKHNMKLNEKVNQRNLYESENVFKSRDKFEPWATQEDFHEQGFKMSRKQHY